METMKLQLPTTSSNGMSAGSKIELKTDTVSEKALSVVILNDMCLMPFSDMLRDSDKCPSFKY